MLHIHVLLILKNIACLLQVIKQLRRQLYNGKKREKYAAEQRTAKKTSATEVQVASRVARLATDKQVMGLAKQRRKVKALQKQVGRFKESKEQLKEIMKRQVITIKEHTSGKVGAPQVSVEVRKIIMLLLGYGVKPGSVRQSLDSVLSLVGIKLPESFEKALSLKSIHTINNERGYVAKAYLAQKILASDTPNSWINQCDGTTTKRHILQVLTNKVWNTIAYTRMYTSTRIITMLRECTLNNKMNVIMISIIQLTFRLFACGTNIAVRDAQCPKRWRVSSANRQHGGATKSYCGNAAGLSRQ